MNYSFTEKKRIRKDFGKLPSVLEVPYLLCGRFLFGNAAYFIWQWKAI